MGRVEGKVALITGAARGQGRSHAVRLAEEGADVILVDICEEIPGLPYAMPTEADLAETVELVEKLDRRAVARKADVRDLEALTAAVDAGVSELGGLDIVSANAGICQVRRAVDITAQDWHTMIDINLSGAFHTAHATLPHLRARGGGSLIFTASICGLDATANLAHYTAAKFGVVGYSKTLALELGPENIRVNAVCPGNVDTEMIQNPTVRGMFLPDVAEPTRADAEAPGSGYRQVNVLDVPWVEAVDVSNVVLWLASDEARYVTGTAQVVDAGFRLT